MIADVIVHSVSRCAVPGIEYLLQKHVFKECYSNILNATTVLLSAIFHPEVLRHVTTHETTQIQHILKNPRTSVKACCHFLLPLYGQANK